MGNANEVFHPKHLETQNSPNKLDERGVAVNAEASRLLTTVLASKRVWLIFSTLTFLFMIFILLYIY
jgi:hypothetical protein